LHFCFVKVGLSNRALLVVKRFKLVGSVPLWAKNGTMVQWFDGFWAAKTNKKTVADIFTYVATKSRLLGDVVTCQVFITTYCLTITVKFAYLCAMLNLFSVVLHHHHGLPPGKRC